MNPSRDDDLILHHWEKTRTDPNEEYRFHKFNKAIELQEFTKDEYKSHLQDPDWTFEETDYLWDLCRRFDLRWVVIQDRYEWPPQEHDLMALKYHAQIVLGNKNTPTTTTTTTEDSSEANTSSSQANSSQPSATPLALSAPAPTTSTSSSTESSKEMVVTKPSKPRSMEDLKHRYYSVTRTLIKSRTIPDGSQAVEKAQMLTSLIYDKDRETERKKNLEILNTRTPEQIEVRKKRFIQMGALTRISFWRLNHWILFLPWAR